MMWRMLNIFSPVEWWSGSEVARVVVKWNTRGKIEERIYSIPKEWI
jgi:hypothetical protein